MQSIWSKTKDLPRQKQGREVIVIEVDKVASGQTKNTTAKLTSQHGLCYHSMVKKIGKTRTLGYARANEEAITTYEQIIKEEGIECQFERLPSFLYSTREDDRGKKYYLCHTLSIS